MFVVSLMPKEITCQCQDDDVFNQAFSHIHREHFAKASAIGYCQFRVQDEIEVEQRKARGQSNHYGSRYSTVNECQHPYS